MDASDTLSLRPRFDGFSFQVSAVEDERFWLRLDRRAGRDIITDYCIGASPSARAGSLLVACYRALGLVPARVVVFGNIVPSADTSDCNTAVDAARAFYSACGAALLATLGSARIDERLEVERGKLNLVLEAVRE